MTTVLIVEDDENMRLLISARLEDNYRIVQACDGFEALQAVEQGGIDLIIADVMMPRMNGYDFVRELRARGYATPVIMATAKQDLSDKRDGFTVGADDYMTKPLIFEELKWRIEALLRRAKIAADNKLVLGEFTLNATSCETLYKGEPLDLPKKEFQLLFKLLSYPNRLFSKDKLMEDIWGYNSDSDDTTLRTHINRLRNKLEKVNEFEITTVRGLGYKAIVRKLK